ncbi:MAG: hypothetical protein ABIA93_02775 [Candidatus Woesearchaeota archaeon]
MAKAQMEIMGLAVIVILVGIGLFYMVAFQAEKPVQKPVQDYTNSQLATNMLIAMLHTDIPACGVDLEDVIYDCGTAYKKLQCVQTSSCGAVIRNATFDMINSTLGVWGTDYTFNVTTDPSIGLSSEVPCSGMRNRKTGIQPIPLYPVQGTVLVTLNICE